MLAVTSACFKGRERLDVPNVSVTLDDTLVGAGDAIRGRVHASDGSGLLLVRVLATSAYDTIPLRADLNDDHQVDLAFTVPVSDTVPAGTRIRVATTVADNQDFFVDVDTTVVVRAP